MKIVLLVVDGMGDAGRLTPLAMAEKHNMDTLASAGRCGLLDIGYKKDVNSDFGFLNLLGCYSKDDYPGRGYLEALGIGLKPKREEVCIRANFATLGKDGMLVDRRAGRDETGLADFCRKLDGTVIDGVKITVRKGMGHRAVLLLLLEGKDLSERIIPNDPLAEKVPVPQVGAAYPEAKKTASVLNKFVRMSHEMLEKEPINKTRKMPANLILIRNPGKRKETESFESRYRMKACCIAGIPIAKGVARFLGMDVIEVRGATGGPDTDLEAKMAAAAEALNQYDFVFLHVNGADILSHDAKRKDKTEFIGKLDRELGRVIRATSGLKGVAMAITCDHRTASSASYMAYRHMVDPVPVLIAGGGITAGNISLFDEHSCGSGFRISGNELVEYMLRLARA